MEAYVRGEAKKTKKDNSEGSNELQCWFTEDKLTKKIRVHLKTAIGEKISFGGDRVPEVIRKLYTYYAIASRKREREEKEKMNTNTSPPQSDETHIIEEKTKSISLEENTTPPPDPMFDEDDIVCDCSSDDKGKNCKIMCDSNL